MLLWCLLVAVAGLASGQESSGEEDCYSSGGVAGIVIATVVVTLVMGGLAAAAIWYLWRQRAGVSGKSETGLLGGVKSPPSTDKPLEGGYAYDNPYFKDDDDDATNPDAAEKGESGFQTDNGDVTHSSNNKWTNAASKPKKNRPFSSLPFHVVFNQGSKKPRAMDDTCIAKQQVERVVVPLKGHDFTGLGFNICGNMRDGIFVKDVLHRGPASESGKIRAGDRIVGVTVSFSGMVYEDALTILSYASPYDVRLEVEKVAGESVAPPPSSASPSGRRLPPSSSFRSGQRLFHPLYRSQSIDDLTQIGKDNLGPTVTGSPSSKVGTSSGAKRSQSVETATSPKSRPHLRQEAPKTPSGGKGSRKSSTSSCESTNKKTSDETPTVSPKEESQESVSHKVKSSKVEEILVKKEAPDNDRAVRFEVTKVLQTESDQLLESVSKDSSKEVEDEPDAYEMDHSKKEEFPTAPPRKSGTPGKRKAPAPPPKSSQGTTETSAIVHRAEDEEDLVPLQEGDQPPSPKRKASSLGDLTQLDEEGHKKSPSSATILERAVSLDLQQQPMPEDNLGKHQKRMLRAPTFEDPEDTSEEDLGHSGEQGASLRRWDESWSKLQSIPTNSDPQITVSEPNFKHRGLWPSETDIAPVITNGHSSARDTVKEDTFDLDVCDVETNSNEPESDKMMTSTPARKVIEVDSFLKGDVDIDDIPYLGDKRPDQEPSSDGVSTMALAGSFLSGRAVTSSPSPVSVSIPIIKPNFTHYEKLPSPPPRKDSSDVKLLTSVHSVHEDVEGSFQQRPDSTLSEETKLHDLSDIRSQSSYRPVFSNKSLDESNVVFTVPMHSSSINDIPLQNEPVVEDTSVVNGSEFSSYRTAIEESSLSSSSSLLGSKKHSSGISGITLHSGVAGFAKTLIITSPEEGENLTLNDALDSPPPQLEPPQ